MAEVQGALRQLGQVWSSWSLGRKMFVGLGTLIGVAGFMAIISLSGRVDYAPLLTGLDPEDGSEITTRLTEMRIPYRLDNNGATIMVPANEIHELRMRLAGEGLPRGGGVGFELFDDPGFGMSRFAEQLNYRRALQGELRRTIRALDAVSDARVHIVLAKKRLFAKDAESSSASVTLFMRRGRQLSKEQVGAVVHMVASSVEGVNPAQVTVVDSTGRILARGGENDEMQALDKGLEYQRSLEGTMEHRVVDIIERVVGPGKVSAQVSVELDFTQSELTTETYDPEAVAVRSEQVSTEDRQSGQADQQGIPGARTNLPGAVAGEAQGNETDSKRNETRNYEISKNVRHELNKVARLKRVSVAVLVDGVRIVAEDGAESFQERPEEELGRLLELAQSAVGFNAGRGDRVTLQSMNFARPDATELADIAAERTWVDWFNMFWRPVSALLFLLLLFGVMRATRKVAATSPTDILQPTSVADLENALGGGAVQAALGGAPGAAGGLAQPRPEPEKAAAVLKGWMVES